MTYSGCLIQMPMWFTSRLRDAAVAHKQNTVLVRARSGREMAAVKDKYLRL